jgi:hypothetical protein
MGELEAALADIDATVCPGPRVNRAEPEPMQSANVISGEAMVRSVVANSGNLRQFQRLRFGRVHVAHSSNAKQIAQHTAARARFELAFRTCSFVFAAHALPVYHRRIGNGFTEKLAFGLRTGELIGRCGRICPWSFDWPGCSHVRVFARHRRVGGVTRTRLPDSKAQRFRRQFSAKAGGLVFSGQSRI